MTSHVIKTANGEVRVAKDSSQLILVAASSMLYTEEVSL